MHLNGLIDNLENPRVAGVCTALLSYFGGESLSGDIDLSRLLAAAISGAFGVVGWLLVTLLNHWLKKRREGRHAERDNG